MTRVAIISEGLVGDLRPIGYGRSTWDIPFLGRPLLAAALSWLERVGCTHALLLDDTRENALATLSTHCPSGLQVHALDLRRHDAPLDETIPPLLASLAPSRVYLLKPCALLDPDLAGLEAFHEQNTSEATFALTRLDPSGLLWPFVPACRMDEHGTILEVDKVPRTEALGSVSLDNVLRTTAPSRPREFWAPRNLAILEPDLALRLPISELVAPLAGLARGLAANGALCHGRAMRGAWWPASTAAEVMTANHEALRTAPDDGGAQRPNKWVSAEARVSPDAHVESSVVAAGAVIAPGASVVGSVLGARAQLGAGAGAHHSLLADDAAVPADVRLVGAVIGSGEVQSLTRGVPLAGQFLDGVHTVDEAAVRTYWRDSVPLDGRDPNAAIVATLARGLENNVYHLADGPRRVVLKRRLDCNARPLVREHHVLRALAGRGIAPPPLIVDLRPEIRVAPCIVMGYVDGEPVEEGSITPPIARAIARACKTLHAVPTDGLLRDLPELAEQAYPDLRAYVTDLVFQYGAWLESRQLGGIDDGLSTQVSALVHWLLERAEHEAPHWGAYVPRVLCQGDLRAFNMVWCGGEIVLLDWERSGVDDPAYDVAWFLALGALSIEAEHAFRESYGTGPPDDGSFWARVDAFRTVHELTWPVHLIELVRSVRNLETPACDPEARSAAYEADAYQALARAFTALARHGGPSAPSPCDAATVRAMGPLLA